MNYRQENTLTMFNTVLAVCSQNSAIIALIAALNNVFALFTTKCLAINDISKVQLLHIKGKTTEKANLKSALALRASIVARVIRAYATSIQNDVLRNEIDYTESVLLKQRDITIQLNAQMIFDRATTHLAALAPFGITAAVMTDLDTAIGDYQAHQTSPTVARDYRAVATTELDLLISETSDLLRFQMDDIMQLLRLTEPSFFRLYTNARRTYDLHGTHSANEGTLSGVVRNATTNLIIENALIELIDSDEVTSSDALGEFQLPKEPGTYSIRVSKDGYTETIVNDIVVVKGEETAITVVLEEMV